MMSGSLGALFSIFRKNHKFAIRLVRRVVNIFKLSWRALMK